ncbi:MAG: hypothetical protein FJ271_15085 [Planctomycetes bacterium]|nr:hypothetical protein [Planctomycetota bacterium]
MSQVSIEKAVNFVTAKPLAWILYWLWLALKHGWLGAMWSARWIRERWRAWRAARTKSVADSETLTNGRAGRIAKRGLAKG